MTNDAARKYNIEAALQDFSNGPFATKARALLNALGYQSERGLDIEPNSPETFVELFCGDRQLTEKAMLEEWQSVDLLFQLTGNDITDQGTFVFEGDNSFNGKIIESYLFFAIALRGGEYTRTQLAGITREINKLFDQPAMVLFRHGGTLTFAMIDRRLNKRDASRDVLEKVTLIKDIDIKQPHRGHVEILFDLSLPELRTAFDPKNFVQLHDAWQQTLSSSELNKRFFKEVANWYFWAQERVVFPVDAGPDTETRNATGLIRLITRLLFVWFLKEKGLVPDELFVEAKLKQILKSLEPEKSTYAKAILQNLFFATLNQEMNTPQKPDNRKFRGEGQNYNITSLYRYRDYFKAPDAALRIFEPIPFLNGGLFECLDKPDTNNPKKILRIDGFSDRGENQLSIPNDLFFAEEQKFDLNSVYGSSNKTYKVQGLLHILGRYKFTITENTPIEEEIALDPELLGRVFENLLAAYNPETKVTARKATGSFYTPREIVNYMVDEALIAHLRSALVTSDTGHKETEERLRQLLAYQVAMPDFSAPEIECLITAIDTLKILDPACGSGAFPLGILHKLVFILGRLDPHNIRWKEKQVSKAEEIADPEAREQAIRGIEEAFERNELDYGRKLYLIENCIFGVDIQPIAVQISKLRCFISLIVDQKVDRTWPNLGIRPLPNLETNFMAANSLIPSERPEQLGLHDLEIDRKEAELKRVRQRHFEARTPQTKAKYRERDRQLRSEISVLLQQLHDFPVRTAELLAHWDPYDQNSSASFFDPEWMFGVADGFDIVIGNPPYIKEYTFRRAFDGLRASPYYQGKMDIWYFFACRAIDVLKPNTGILSFIATNNWTTNAGASILRNKIAADSRILQLIDFVDYKIFENADIQTMILICQRNKLEQQYEFDLRRISSAKPTWDDIISILAKNPGTRIECFTANFDRKLMRNGKLFVFALDSIQYVLNTISNCANFILDKNDEVAQGIVAPQDFVNNASRALLDNQVAVGDGIFVLSTDEKEELHLSSQDLTLIKPYYTTLELHKYYANRHNSYWIIYTNSSFGNPDNIKPYPHVRAHLDRFRAVITSDNRPYGLHRSRNPAFFTGEKIISVRKCDEPTFTYTNFDCYVSQTFNIIKSNRVNMKYLTGLFNSELVAFWLRHRGKMQGHHFQVDKGPLLSIPLLVPIPGEQMPIIRLVDQILDAKRGNATSDVSTQEKEIDRLVYQLYGLTQDEQSIVEGKTALDLEAVRE